jgi:hypothetical protein
MAADTLTRLVYGISLHIKWPAEEEAQDNILITDVMLCVVFAFYLDREMNRPAVPTGLGLGPAEEEAQDIKHPMVLTVLGLLPIMARYRPEEST